MRTTTQRLSDRSADILPLVGQEALTMLKIYPVSEGRPMFENYQSLWAAFLAGVVGALGLALLADYCLGIL
ncbi:MAG: hypothetical protein ACJ74Z_16120 [Bryobacteraceae bacterium]